MRFVVKNVLIYGVIAMLWGCSPKDRFDSVKPLCSEDLEPNLSLEALQTLYKDQIVKINEDYLVEGYVVSSDEAGNFFNTLHIQDTPANPSVGFSIEIDLRDLHVRFGPGQKIYIKLQGLYLDEKQGAYSIGTVWNVFGNLSIGRLPAHLLNQHVYLACDPKTEITTKLQTIVELKDQQLNTLVAIDNVQVVQEEQGSSFAEFEEPSFRTLIDCAQNEILLLNSGYADFAQEQLPSGRGSATGVLLKQSGKYHLVLRSQEDLKLVEETCIQETKLMSSPNVFISEIADPDNNRFARFIELYNSGSTTVFLDKWTLQRYTNDNLEVSSSLDLSGMQIQPKSTLVIAANQDEFSITYGMEADLEGGINSAADSNGDDNILLVDPFGNRMDLFGKIGEDGSGTNHEFEDGKAYRIPQIQVGNEEFNTSEWIIYNDTGDHGTIKKPQLAPQDFTPGIR